MLTRRTVILAIKETTYGTDPAMTGTNAILAWDVDLDVKGELLERPFLRDSLSPLPFVVGLKECALNFKAELKGSNSSPDIAPLLSACGFGTAVTSGTAITFSLISDEVSMCSAALKVYKDGNLHKITGARGNVKFILEAGKYGVGEFSLQGLYNAVIADTIPNISGLSANKPPIIYNSSFQIASFSPVCSKAEIDLGNTIVRRDSLNATFGVQEFRITGRKPKLSFDADAVVESSNPFWGDWSGQIVDTFSVNIGSTAGNRLIIGGIFQYETNKYADKDGISAYECVAGLVSSDQDTGNDELTLKYIIA